MQGASITSEAKRKLQRRLKDIHPDIQAAFMRRAERKLEEAQEKSAQLGEPPATEHEASALKQRLLENEIEILRVFPTRAQQDALLRRSEANVPSDTNIRLDNLYCMLNSADFIQAVFADEQRNGGNAVGRILERKTDGQVSHL